ncbi:protein L-Myc-1a [Hoplias malabaricus]|uniref:protein L-Myc-1a n=1 Tax=Hoplias malabaricus TaxID=27720 RepID=UPI0034626643
MPGLSCSAGFWPMELESQQHYFYYDGLDTGEDFYKSTAPSEDIWKKFELLPTPPVSPSRPWATQDVTFEEDYGPPFELELEPLDVLANLSSIVLKDCMWSGLAVGQQLEKISRDAKVVSTTRAQRVAPATALTHSSPATQCVSPAAVLSLPGHHGKKTVSGSSGSDSHSDSSDEDEIDVVTVDNRPKRGRPPGRRTPVTIAVSADPHGPCPKHFHISLHRQQHNYAAPSPESDHEEEDLEPQGKRARLEASSSSSSSPLSSPATSDSEDSTEQRRNFLERKRRDDLRSRFQALRSEVPGLSESAKTSKVAILTRATEYLVQLKARERRQNQEKKKLRAKQQQLLRKIYVLKNS